MTELKTYNIYIIKCCDPLIDYTYIGSTKNFYMRYCKHKHNSKNSELKLYKCIRENGGFKNWTIDIIDSITTNDIMEVRLKEQDYIIKQVNKLNIHNAFITAEDARIKQLNQKKEYYLNNKDIKLDYAKKYYNLNKKIKLDYAKRYYNLNKSKILEYAKQQYLNKKSDNPII
jgi:hypothetical protein